jgi:hypothetical protein
VVAGLGAAAFWVLKDRAGGSWPSPQPSPTSVDAGRARDAGGRSRERGQETAAAAVAAPSPWRWLWALAMPFLGLALVGAIAPPGLLWQDEPAAYDVTEYHLQVPREWYEAGRITGLKHNAFSYMPMNAEMHDLLAMHLRGGPWAGMYLAQFIHVVTMALAVLAVAGVARALSDRPWAGPLAGVAMAATPWVTSLAPIAYNEAALMLFAALAVGWAMLARDWRGWAVAGAMAGFACGVKLTAGPMVVGAVAVAAVAANVRSQTSHAKSGIAVFIGVAAAVFAPWLIRNAIWTGNPVFPEAMETSGKAHFSDAQVARWRAAHSPAVGDRGLGGRLGAAALRIAGEWQFGYLLLPLAVAALIVRRDRRSMMLAVVLVAQLIIWLAFTHLQGRFFVVAIPVAAVAIGGGRDKVWPYVAGASVAVMAVVGFCVLNLHPMRFPLVRQLAAKQALGAEQLGALVPIDPDTLPPEGPINLVGDAQAFLYSGVPMTRLRYRTVFDVPPPAKDGDWLTAWTGGERNGTALVFPGELLRFKRTYVDVPSPPEDQLEGRSPYVLPNR